MRLGSRTLLGNVLTDLAARHEIVISLLSEYFPLHMKCVVGTGASYSCSCGLEEPRRA